MTPDNTILNIPGVINGADTKLDFSLIGEEPSLYFSLEGESKKKWKLSICMQSMETVVINQLNFYSVELLLRQHPMQAQKELGNRVARLGLKPTDISWKDIALWLNCYPLANQSLNLYKEYYSLMANATPKGMVEIRGLASLCACQGGQQRALAITTLSPLNNATWPSTADSFSIFLRRYHETARCIREGKIFDINFIYPQLLRLNEDLPKMLIGTKKVVQQNILAHLDLYTALTDCLVSFNLDQVKKQIRDSWLLAIGKVRIKYGRGNKKVHQFKRKISTRKVFEHHEIFYQANYAQQGLLHLVGSRTKEGARATKALHAGIGTGSLAGGIAGAAGTAGGSVAAASLIASKQFKQALGKKKGQHFWYGFVRLWNLRFQNPQKITIDGIEQLRDEITEILNMEALSKKKTVIQGFINKTSAKKKKASKKAKKELEKKFTEVDGQTAKFIKEAYWNLFYRMAQLIEEFVVPSSGELLDALADELGVDKGELSKGLGADDKLSLQKKLQEGLAYGNQAFRFNKPRISQLQAIGILASLLKILHGAQVHPQAMLQMYRSLTHIAGTHPLSKDLISVMLNILQLPDLDGLTDEYFNKLIIKAKQSFFSEAKTNFEKIHGFFKKEQESYLEPEEAGTDSSLNEKLLSDQLDPEEKEEHDEGEELITSLARSISAVEAAVPEEDYHLSEALEKVFESHLEPEEADSDSSVES